MGLLHLLLPGLYQTRCIVNIVNDVQSIVLVDSPSITAMKSCLEYTCMHNSG